MNKFALSRHLLLPLLLAGVLAIFISAFYTFTFNLQATEEKAVQETLKLEHVLDMAKGLVIQRVYSSMELFKRKSLYFGAPNIDGTTQLLGESIPNLRLGNNAQTQHIQLVDSVTEIGSGTATIFVKRDKEFIRISTNVRKKDNARAIGTQLDPEGRVIQHLKIGEPFYGVVDILGEPYISGYEPIFDSNRQVFGAWYVGYKVNVNALESAIKEWHFLKSGFAAITDYNNDIRFLSGHITIDEAKNTLKNADKKWFITSRNIPEWNFQAHIAFPYRDAYLSSAAPLYPVLILSGVLGILLLAVIQRGIRRFVLTPLGGEPKVASELVKNIAQGHFDDDGLVAEPGTLIGNMLKMRTQLHKMVEEIKENNDKLSTSSSVFQHAHDGIFITDPQGTIIEINPAFTDITGYTHAESIGKQPSELGFAHQLDGFFSSLLNSDEYYDGRRGEVWCLHKSGQPYAAWLDMFPVRNEDAQLLHYVGLFSDNTVAKEQQKVLEHLAYHDALTKLPNRVMFANQLQKALAAIELSKEAIAICYVDLDNFKPINDQHGHEVGDQLLVSLAERLQDNSRNEDVVARLGGDEFALLLSGLPTAVEYASALDRILTAIEQPFYIADHIFFISASIGFTVYPNDNNPPDTLLRHADHAMYHAKTHGGKQHHLFDLKLAKLSQSEQEIKQDVLDGLKNDQFLLYYQPQIDLVTGKVIGVEALIRWQHPTRGFLMPDAFLPIIEHTQLINEIGEWVTLKALAQIDEWQKQGLDFHVSINIAAYHITDNNFVQFFAHALTQYADVPGKKLNVEITESAAINDVGKVTETMKACKSLGITFSLDDFGIGYSSLIYLRKLPFDVIKIDRSFTSDILTDSEDLAVVTGVITLSKQFNRTVIAEGAETDEQLIKLQSLGCDYAQGYGIAKPMPVEEVASWIETNNPFKFQ